MKTEEEIKNKIQELEGELEDIEEEFEETVEDEDIDEFSEPERWEELRDEFDTKKEIVEEQIKILQWVLGQKG